MISHENKFIFIHISKTAGKSILKALSLPSAADHRNATQQFKEYGPEIWDQYFKFCFVRNPWDRLVSGYFYRVGGGSGERDDLERAKIYPPTFQEFCSNLERFMLLPNEGMFVPQVDWITNQGGGLMVDFVGKFEQLDKDFSFICNKIGVESRLQHINKSRHKPYWSYYDNRSVELVREAYKKDIEHFDYQFEKGEPKKFFSFLQPVINRFR